MWGQVGTQADSHATDSEQEQKIARIKKGDEWFYRGRIVRSFPSAELRRRAYQAKLQLRAQHAAAVGYVSGQISFSTGSWTPLGPVPLASDASGNGTQDYRQVAGRATAVAIDPADSSGNTVFVGGAQSGVWKSTNAANTTANSVTWTPISDDQATLSIGAIAIQPGNSNPVKSLILAATGEADSSSDSYFGLGFLRSTDGGNNWSLIRTANNGALSFSGLGGTSLAFSSPANQTNTVVAAMGTSTEGVVADAVTTGSTPGLFTSLDAGQTWTYDALSDPGGATDATSATSIVYNAGSAQFFAAVRYHGFYSSPDGVTWTRLVNQPGGSVLSTAACPPQSVSNGYACPMYRGEITTVPGRNEMYAWYVSLATNGAVVDGGIWQSLNGGISWISISNSGITNCGDFEGCGVEQGAYNLGILAVPNGSGVTDLYAAAVNIYKCSLTPQNPTLNPTCSNSPFINLTHAFGCVPIAAPAHVHPSQHALAAMIPTSGSDSGNELLFFANDGGMYRALNGYSGLNSGACSGMNQFDDLNQNLGSMAQFISFSQHPSDANTLLGGTQDNGSPATNQATTNSSWGNVLGGDGGFNLIDPFVSSNFFASNPDIPPDGLGIQLCPNGVNCNNGEFSFVVTSGTVGGDDGGFYFPFIFDPASTSAMLVGTCRVWRGPRTGGTYVALSPNFDSLGSGSCEGTEVNDVRALAAAGMPDGNGSSTIYATTNGMGPIDGPLSSPTGGRVWATTSASSGIGSFADVTDNGPLGSINPNQFPISGVATDSSDASGKTAYVTVMGFTGGAGHVWKTTNAGATWTDFTANLPDSPANAVVVYPAMSQVFVGTDVGVFASPTSSASWTELGPAPSTDQPGFLPNVPVTALGIFNSGGQQLLRASTYGRGIWQFNLVVTPDFTLSVSNSPLTVFVGQTASFTGTSTSLNGYNSSVTLSCSAGTTGPPTTCSASPSSFVPANKTPFIVTAGGSAKDYTFNVKATGSDSKNVTHTVPVTLHVLSFTLGSPSPSSVTAPRGTTSPAVNFQITAAGSFNQSVTVSCTSAVSNANCNLTPGNTVYPTASSPVNMTATMDIPAGTSPGSYPVTIQASTAGAPGPLTNSFTLVVTSNPDFTLSEPNPFPEMKVGGASASGSISIGSQDGFAGTVMLSCPASAASGACSISPASLSSLPGAATLTLNPATFSAGSYSISINGTSGSDVHSLSVPFNVGDYSVSGPKTLIGVPAEQTTASLKLASSFSYAGSINATCEASALPGATCTLSATSINLAANENANFDALINIPNTASPGTYNIIVNTNDVSGAPSHSITIALSLAQDFVVTSATPTQTVTAGQTSGPYALTVQPVGSSFTGAISLACTAGLPAGSQCNFSPATPITPGNSAVDVVMSISTKAANSNLRFGFAVMWLVLLPGLVLGGALSRNSRAKFHRTGLFTLAIFLLALLTSCAGVSNGGSGGGGSGGNPVTYKVTVTGTSPGTTPDSGQSTVVTLVVD